MMARKNNNVVSETVSDDPKWAAMQQVVNSIKKEFGESSVFAATDRGLSVDVISTGSLSIDIATGVGGFPRGRIIEVFGPESSGKTTIALSAIASAQKAGGTTVFIDTENALDPTYAERIGINLDRLLISQPNSGEEALRIAEKFVENGVVDLIVLDSVAALVPSAEISGEIGDSHVGLQARLMSQALRKLSGIINKTKTVMIFTNQLRDKVGMSSYGPSETTSGGRALKFYATMRLDVRRIQSLKTSSGVVGARTKVKIVKNKVAPPFREAEFDIIFPNGISLPGELIDYGVANNLVSKRGAYFEFEDVRAQGKDKMRAALIEKPEAAFRLHSQVLALYGLPELTYMPRYGDVHDTVEISEDDFSSVNPDFELEE
jgi:recombination protein RecA